MHLPWWIPVGLYAVESWSQLVSGEGVFLGPPNQRISSDQPCLFTRVPGALQDLLRSNSVLRSFCSIRNR